MPPSAPTKVDVDLAAHPAAQKLVAECVEFLGEIADLTPGKSLEEHLNESYGPGNRHYDVFCDLVRQGLQEGWVGTKEVEGRKFRVSALAMPGPETRYFSITTVYIEAPIDGAWANRGRHHVHPYGEINCVVQIDEKAQLMGMHGWRGPGWTCPAPGTHHDPEVRNGALVALFFLPAGRISYNKDASDPQPIYT